MAIIKKSAPLEKGADIDVTTYYAERSQPYLVTVNMSLTYPDWCKLKESTEWERLVAYVQRPQTEANK